MDLQYAHWTKIIIILTGEDDIARFDSRRYNYGIWASLAWRHDNEYYEHEHHEHGKATRTLTWEWARTRTWPRTRTRTWTWAWTGTRTRTRIRTRTCQNAGPGLKKNWRCRKRSVIEIKRHSMVFLGRVPDWDNRCRNSDVSTSFLDTDVQLCLLSTWNATQQVYEMKLEVLMKEAECNFAYSMSMQNEEGIIAHKQSKQNDINLRGQNRTYFRRRSGSQVGLLHVMSSGLKSHVTVFKISTSVSLGQHITEAKGRSRRTEVDERKYN